MSSELNSNFDALFGKIESFVSTKTVVGEPIHIGDIIILPLVDVVFGAGAGTGADKGSDDKGSSAGGGGLGAKITPSAVIVIHDGNVQMVNVKNQDSLNKLIDMAPSLLSKLGITSLFNKSKSSGSDPAGAQSAPEAPAEASAQP